MIYYIGIDPSMNSTGICVQKYDSDKKLSEEFIILKPGYKEKPESKWLTKKEKLAEEAFQNFNYSTCRSMRNSGYYGTCGQVQWFHYCFYPKMDLTPYKELNHYMEYWKSWNMKMCANTIKDIVKEWTKDNPEKIHILMEGISYGSVQRTKSIFDLAGLNYLIREKFISDDYDLTIATPSEIKKFASGNGNCKKEVMIALFKMTYPEFEIIPKIDDISDAWFMANYAKTINTKKVT